MPTPDSGPARGTDRRRLSAQARSRSARVVRLGAERIDLAIEFLREKIEPAADRLAAARARAPPRYGLRGGRSPRGYRRWRRATRLPGAAGRGRAQARHREEQRSARRGARGCPAGGRATLGGAGQPPISSRRAASTLPRAAPSRVRIAARSTRARSRPARISAIEDGASILVLLLGSLDHAAQGQHPVERRRLDVERGGNPLHRGDHIGKDRFIDAEAARRRTGLEVQRRLDVAAREARRATLASRRSSRS